MAEGTVPSCFNSEDLHANATQHNGTAMCSCTLALRYSRKPRWRLGQESPQEDKLRLLPT
ncbi:putative exo-1,4-beta-xylosidase bxlB [Clarias magur]|uniref:Putative exo-1,4-beta-xylosidase bxlB n=1 Tax=Clarias magur TaxID=1594786 RepID=A0A8J4UA38_CLAMG|nr:putative exo-1,4-beta-xylosidase bxlB [Clarias magur]